MKQIIVMISMIMLGIAIAGFVGEFKGSADSISDDTRERVEDVVPSTTGS